MISQCIIISKWHRIQKCRQKKKTMRQKGNCLQKSFHSFKYVIYHPNVSKLSTLLPVIPPVLLAASSQIVSELLQVYSYTNLLFEYHTNIWIFKKSRKGMFCNKKLSDLANFLQSCLRTESAGECIFRASGEQILKTFPLSNNYGGTFVGSMYVPVCPKKFWIRHCLVRKCK